MSRQSKRDTFERNKERVRKAHENGEISESDRDAILEFLAAKDPEDYSNTDPDDDGKSNSTLVEYASKLRLTAVRSTIPLTEMDTDDVNTLMADFRHGNTRVLDPDHLGNDSEAHKNADDVNPDGLSQGGVRGFQSILRKFYEYYDELRIDKDEIQLENMPEPTVDERDMFTQEEIEALRDACKNPRDRCLIELLLNTGQRIQALLTLRVKDVDLENGVYYLNEEADGLKGADDYGKKRPLLGARSAVRKWLNDYHPCPDDPEAALITNLPGYTMAGHDPGEPLAPQYVNQRLSKLGEEASVDKPTNPHAWRHNFVTIAHREYDMDKDTIRHLIGHGPNSKVMETTYKHLDDDDYIQAAEAAMGISEPETEASLTPAVCRVCDEPLQPDWKTCPTCGEVYAPDAKAVQTQIQDTMKESYAETDPEEDAIQEKIRELDALLDDPELKAALLERTRNE